MWINIALVVMAAIGAGVLRWLLTRDNNRLARMADGDATLTEADMAHLRKTAELEGIDIATARQLQKSYRYMI
ncbi:hypothetical protein LTR91_010871 [Friedmanniomyces endolithicus]|uniref:Uncharacterized protein n=1 Tax=Friedmanniomyces endolithicus TaxID=329885 RepID=A0AAN6KI86_9PEZI|nr:hypothetical protein LTR94_020116 [Friedmanniomyces endolithicus]KAK0774110.1 hypothetical protein LTR38_016336 [Friedmanniomyces endolithicus]KAK0787514.1 hypothetical protein LTR75_012898 [Friedmanniomyces endolithicus]KAK0837016.1 hypothetical protein LTR03_013186 [Friedmanniomyces endolithicus]KAK0868987.1 hypothetical protein LTR87_013896 [Friedmanniomyces endolithicus]